MRRAPFAHASRSLRSPRSATSRRCSCSPGLNLADALLATGVSDPSRVVLTGSAPVTYGELLERAAAVQAFVRPDARVAIVAGAEPEFLVAYLGVLRAGGVAVPLNVAAPSHE